MLKQAVCSIHAPLNFLNARHASYWKSFWSISQKIKQLLYKSNTDTNATPVTDDSGNATAITASSNYNKAPASSLPSSCNATAITASSNNNKAPASSLPSSCNDSSTSGEIYFPHKYYSKDDGFDIHPDIQKLFDRTKPRLIDGFWKRGELSLLQLARYKSQFIRDGYDWPRKKLRDISKTFLERKGRVREVTRLIRKKNVEENMLKMPEMVKSFIEQKQKERSDELAKTTKTEKQIYLRLTGKIAEENADWIEKRILKSKERKEMFLKAAKSKKKKK